MQALNEENLGRLNRRNYYRSQGDDPRLNRLNKNPYGQSSAGIDVASIYTHSVVDGAYRSGDNFTTELLNSFDLEAMLQNYSPTENRGTDSYFDIFSIIPGNCEYDKVNDEQDQQDGYQVVNEKRMKPFGWYFERIKVNGTFKCCSNDWSTNYGTLEIQFKDPCGFKDVQKLNKNAKNKALIKFNAIVYDQECKKCEKQPGEFRFQFKNEREKDRVKIMIIEKILKTFSLPFKTLKPPFKGIRRQPPSEMHMDKLCHACREGVCTYSSKYLRDHDKEIFALHRVFKVQERENLLKPCDDTQKALLFALRQFGLRGNNFITLPENATAQDEMLSRAWTSIEGHPELTKEKAAEMYIVSVRKFINWRRTKMRI